MKCDFNLLCYNFFEIPKIIIILKAILRILKSLLKKILLWFKKYVL